MALLYYDSFDRFTSADDWGLVTVLEDFEMEVGGFELTPTHDVVPPNAYGVDPARDGAERTGLYGFEIGEREVTLRFTTSLAALGAAFANFFRAGTEAAAAVEEEVARAERNRIIPEIDGNAYARATAPGRLTWQHMRPIRQYREADPAVRAARIAEGRLQVEEAKKAARVARKLLLSHLTPVQKRQDRNRGAFGVIGSNGGRYVIDTRYDEVFGYDPTLERVTYYCIQPKPYGSMPRSDKHLAVKWYIEADEALFLKTGVPSVMNMRPREIARGMRMTDEVLAERREMIDKGIETLLSWTKRERTPQ